MTAEFSHEPKRRIQPTLGIVLILSAALAVSALALKALPAPFVWIDLTWAAALVGGLFCLHGSRPVWSLSCLRGNWFRRVLFHIAVALVALAGVEAYCSLHQNRPVVYSSEFYVLDDAQGAVPIKNAQVHATHKTFNVTYTIDSNGLRVAPPAQQDAHAGCILFFGDSFTFGDGLEDKETLPYQVALQSGGRYRTLNFAFEGYGPHQMLSAIETGRVRRVVDDCTPEYAFYAAITDHVRRAVGKVPYGKHGPRYVLDPDGTVHRDGNFEGLERTYSPVEAEVRWQFGKSAIYSLVADRPPHPTEDDVRTTLAIVRRSRDLLGEQYPGLKFQVLFWPDWNRDGDLSRELQDGFRQLSIPVHRVEDALPAFTPASSEYSISYDNNHPNALANRILANYVLTKIVATEPAVRAASK